MENTITNYIEGNRIIAEFMDIDYDAAVQAQKAEIYHSGYRDPKTIDANYIFYHNSWDWLMEVVERIAELPNTKYPNGLYKYLVDVEIIVTTNLVRIVDAYNADDLSIECYDGSLIENVYTAVLSFINWHNKQLKTEE